MLTFSIYIFCNKIRVYNISNKSAKQFTHCYQSQFTLDSSNFTPPCFMGLFMSNQCLTCVINVASHRKKLSLAVFICFHRRLTRKTSFQVHIIYLSIFIY